MGGKKVRAEDVIRIYQNLSAHNVQAWLTGGWGIDALLQTQTRPHKDLDVIILVEDIVRMRELLSHDGYDLNHLWPENSWIVDANGVEVPTAFVLQDSEGREVDAHAIRLDDQGGGIPAWLNDGLVFRMEDLAGKGMIAGVAVRCLSPEMQMVCHEGYDLPDEQFRDLELLEEKFDIQSPHGNPFSRRSLP